MILGSITPPYTSPKVSRRSSSNPSPAVKLKRTSPLTYYRVADWTLMPLKLGWKAYLCENVSPAEPPPIQAAAAKPPQESLSQASPRRGAVLTAKSQKILHAQGSYGSNVLGAESALEFRSAEGSLFAARKS